MNIRWGVANQVMFRICLLMLNVLNRINIAVKFLVASRIVFEPRQSSIEYLSLTYLILFRTRVELELITELNILFKLGSFNFISNTS
jgi:hypothetical protein